MSKLKAISRQFPGLRLIAALLCCAAIPAELQSNAEPNSPPLVVLGSPLNNASFDNPANILISAAAIDLDGSIDLVEFFEGTNKLYETTSPPYDHLWTNVGPGTYTFSAVATDNLGASATSETIQATVHPVIPPTIAGFSPPAGTLDSLTSITVIFNEPVLGVDPGDLLINGAPATTVSGSGTTYLFLFPEPGHGPASISFDPGHGIIDFEIPARPFDPGHPSSSWQYTINDTAAPIVTSLSPGAGATVHALDAITVQFNEAVIGLNAADLLIDDTPATTLSGSGRGPYVFGFPPRPNGIVRLGWAPGHGITDTSPAANPFPGGNWGYTIDPSAILDSVVINEIMYHPASGRASEEYIELLNTGTETIDLTGWRLSSGVQFTFPSLTIGPGGCLVVVADVGTFTALHPSITNRVGNWDGQLSDSREQITLQDREGTTIDRIAYADEGDGSLRIQAGAGWRWRSEHDGLGSSLELRNPALPTTPSHNWAASLIPGGTPGTTNSTASGDIPPMILDLAHFPAVPTSADPVTINARIIDELSTGLAVTLHHRNAAALAPAAFSSTAMFDDGAHNDASPGDGIYGIELPPMTNLTVTEFYVEAVDQTGNTRTWPAPALLDSGATAQVANALFQVDDTAYDGPQPLYRIVTTEPDREAFANAPRTDEQRNATFISSSGGGLQVRYGAGIRYRGNTSRNSEVPSYRVNIPSDRPWNGVTSLNLNSERTYSQLLSAVLSRKAGLPAADAIAVQFRFNGQNPAGNDPLQYGSYVHVEVLDGEWARHHFPNDGGGNVYRCIGHQATLEYEGTNPLNYASKGYEKKSNVSANDWLDLMNLTHTLSESPDADYASRVWRNVDVGAWMRYFATSTLVGYNETALSTGRGDDYALYRGILDPRFKVLPHDFDTTLTSGGNQNQSIYIATSLPTISRFLLHPAFSPLYHAEIRRQIETVFSPDEFDPLVDQHLGGWVPPTALRDIKDWMAARVAIVLGQLPPPPPDPVRAVILDVPTAPTYLRNITLTIGGNGITHYRYQLNGTGYSVEIPAFIPIFLTALPSGTYVVSVIGRNAAGEWQSPEQATQSPGFIVDPSLNGIVLNEVLASNRSAAEHQGSFPDLIELHNTTSAPIDLGGMRLSDSAADPNRYVFPSPTLLPARGYLVVYAGSDDLLPGLHAGFALAQSGEGVYLFENAAAGGALRDSVVFGPQIADLSLARLTHGSWGLAIPTPGAPNRSSPTGSQTGLRINEWLTSPSPGLQLDFIELHNPDPLPVALGGLFLTDDPHGDPGRQQIPPLSFIAGGGFIAFTLNSDSTPLEFKLSSAHGPIGLTDGASVLDCVYYPPQQPGVAQGRFPDGAPSFNSLIFPTPGEPNRNASDPTPAGLVLNEVLASNESMMEAGGSTPDWVEVYNSSVSPVDLAGLSLSDSLDNPLRWIFPPGSIINGHGFFQVLFDPTQPPSASNTGFGLKASGETLHLFNASTAGGELLDTLTFGIQTPGLSIGRVPDGGAWTLAFPTPLSANLDVSLGDPAALRINEWMADPASGDDWFELYNPNPQPVALGGLHLSDDLLDREKTRIPGLSFIGSGLHGYLRIIADGDLTRGAGHAGFKLSGGGESIGLSGTGGIPIDSVTFAVQTEGVSEGRLPDGAISIQRFPDSPTPGSMNFIPLTTVIVNEVLTDGGLPLEDAIELHNLSPEPVDIGGWYLSDDRRFLARHRIPAATLIPGGGYVVLYEAGFNPVPSGPGNFELISSRGGELFVSAADTEGALTGYLNSTRFGAAETGVSLGRHVNSQGRVEFVSMAARTFGIDQPLSVEQFRTGSGLPNSIPKVGPVVIREIMYHPPDIDGTNDNVLEEYVQLRNITGSRVNLYDPDHPANRWFLAGAVRYLFPSGIALPPFSTAYVVGFDPVADRARLAAFKSRYPLASPAIVFGPYEGKLGNNGDELELYKPGIPEPAGSPQAGLVPQILQERVCYSDQPPWPSEAGGLGAALTRINPGAYGNDPLNWTSTVPSPDADTDSDGMSDGFEAAHRLDPLNPADAQTDLDGDGSSNLEESLAGTDPGDPASILRLELLSTPPTLMRFEALAGRTYAVEYTDTIQPPNWTLLTPVGAGTTSRYLIILDPAPPACRFYRLRTP